VGGGAVAGAVGVATFGLGTAVMGTGLGATVAAGAISGAVSGQAARATENALSGQEVTAGLGNPVDIAADAVIGGALAGVGYGMGRLARPAAQASESLEPPMLRAGRLTHQRLGVRYLEGIPPEQRPYVDIDRTFVDPLTGERFRPDVVNHITGEVVEYKPQSWKAIPGLKQQAEEQAASYAGRLNALYEDWRRWEGLPEYWWRVEYYR